MIIPIVLFAFGSWLLYLERELIRLGLASYRWAKTQGEIVDSRNDSFVISGVGGSSGKSGGVPVMYKEFAHEYLYHVDGRAYRCSTYCFGGWADRADARYLIGTSVVVYFNPRRPGEAVLRRGIQLGAIFGIFPIALAVFYFVRSWQA